MNRLIGLVIMAVAIQTFPEFARAHDRSQAIIALLEAKIATLETENAALRQQLRERDKSKQPAKAAEQPKVTMQSIPGCLACELWYESERPKLVAAGWAVDRQTVTTWPAGRIFPRWRVCFNTQCSEIDNCNFNEFMNRLRQLVER